MSVVNINHKVTLENNVKSSHIDSCDLIEILNLLYPRVCDGNVKGDKTSSLLRQLIDSVSALDAVWCSLFMRQKVLSKTIAALLMQIINMNLLC